MSLFDFVPESFFAVLNSKHKITYIESINILYDQITSGTEVGVRREIVAAMIYDYLCATTSDEFVIEDDNKVATKDFASLILRKLKDSGWLEEEVDNNYQRKIFFTRVGYLFANLFKRFTSNSLDDEVIAEVDYQNYIHTIYTYLRDYKSIEGRYLFEVIYKQMNDLKSLLKQLASSIKAYIESSLKQKDAESILKMHFDDYRSTIGSSYHLLKTDDNVAKFKGAIIDSIEALLADEKYINESIASMIMETEILNRDFFYGTIHKKLREVLNFFNFEMELIIKEIDERHAEYIRSTINRFKFLTNRSQNVEGQINTILKHLVDQIHCGNLSETSTDVQVTSQLVSIFHSPYIDERSLYTPRSRSSEFRPGRIATNIGENNNSTQALLDRLAKRRNKKKAMEYVDQLLQHNNTLTGNQIEVNSSQQLIDLVNVLIYGRSPNSGYIIDVLDEYVDGDLAQFKDFIIRRT